MIYPNKLNSKKSNLIVKVGFTISLFICVLLYVINKIINPSIPWSVIANVGIIYIWVILFYTINKRINIAGHVLLHMIATSILVQFIDYKLGFNKWSIHIISPIIIIIANITMLIITIVSHKKYIKYAIYQLLIVIYSLILVLAITDNITHDKLIGIIASGVSIINLFVSLFWCAQDIKEALARKMHT